MNRLVVKKSREKQLQQKLRDFTNAALERQVHRVEPVDPAHARVGGDQLVGQLRQRFQISDFFGATGAFGAAGFFSSTASLPSFSSFGAFSNALISAGGSNIASGTLSNSTDSTT